MSKAIKITAEKIKELSDFLYEIYNGIGIVTDTWAYNAFSYAYKEVPENIRLIVFNAYQQNKTPEQIKRMINKKSKK